MKQKFLNLKSWLLMMCLLVGVSSAWAEDVVYKTATLSASSFSKKVQDYGNSFSSTTEDFTVDIVNFNNNNSGWDYIKTGNKSNASVGTITTNAAIDKAITKVVVTIDVITASSVNSITLYSGTSASSCTTSEGTFSKSVGTQAVTISNPAANKYYKIAFDCKKGSSNGLVQVSKVEYYINEGGSTPEPIKYDVAIANNIANGTVTANPTSAKEGDEVTLTATPATGYEFGSWNVTDAASNPITVTDNKFRMPAANVNVSAIFNQIQGGGEPSGETASFIFNTDAGLSALGISKPNAGVGIDLGVSKYTSGDITMTATNGGTNTRVWNSNGTTNLRVYKNGGSLTFSGAKITKVVFTGTVPMKANVGTFSSKTWTGEATSVTFTATESVTISTIEVTYASDSKITPTLSFAEETYNVNKGESFAAPILNNPDNVTVTYTSSKTDVATVNETTGEVTLVAPGTTKITASFAGDDTYKAASASYDLVVAGAKYTVTIETPENGTLTIKDGENIINSGDKVAEGTNLTIVVEAADGYKFKNWQYKVGDAAWATRYTNPQNYDMPSANVQFRANCDPIPTYTIAWSVNGTIVKSEELKEGATVTAPATPEDINDKTFTGWVETSTVGADATPAYVTPSATAEKTVTYYAVFATTDGQEPSAYVRVTELSQLAEKKQIVVVHNSDNMVLTHENGNLSGTTQGTAGLTESDNKISIPNDNYVWSIGGDEENGWVLSANGNSLGVNTLPDTDRTGQNADISFTSSNNVWTIGEHNTSGCFYIQNLSKTDGSILIAASYYSNKFNVFTTNNLASSTSSAFKLYVPNAAITYSDYTTTVAVPEDYVVTTADTEFYSLYLDHAVSIPDNVKAYTGKLNSDGNKLVLTEIKGTIPANTGVVFKTPDAAGKATFVACDDVESLDNDIKGVLVETPVANITVGTNEAVLVLGAIDGGKIGFGKPKAANLKANRAYIIASTSTAAAKGVSIVINDDATAIENVKAESKSAQAYNLAGQRVAANTKGIVIVNGKKMLNK